MKKRIIIIVSLILALTIIIFISLEMNRNTIEAQKEMRTKAEIIL